MSFQAAGFQDENYTGSEVQCFNAATCEELGLALLLEPVRLRFPHVEFMKVAAAGFGQVYKCFFSDGTYQGRIAAVKVVTPGDGCTLSKVDELLERLFIREVKSLAQLDHPSVIKFLGVGSLEKFGYLRHCIFLEWMPGGDARTLVSEAMRGMGESAAGSVILPVARALEEAHRLGIVHRDVKASNVLLAPGVGNVKLADWGISASVQEVVEEVKAQQGSPRGRRGGNIGTEFWAAPEVEQGLLHDQACDIFSLAITFIELILGSDPKYDNSPEGYHRLPYEDAGFIPSHLSEEVQEWLRACLRAAPVERPTAQELLQHNFFKRMAQDMERERLRMEESDSSEELPLVQPGQPGAVPLEDAEPVHIPALPRPVTTTAPVNHLSSTSLGGTISSSPGIEEVSKGASSIYVRPGSGCDSHGSVTSAGIGHTAIGHSFNAAADRSLATAGFDAPYNHELLLERLNTLRTMSNTSRSPAPFASGSRRASFIFANRPVFGGLEGRLSVNSSFAHGRRASRLSAGGSPHLPMGSQFPGGFVDALTHAAPSMSDQGSGHIVRGSESKLAGTSSSGHAMQSRPTSSLAACIENTSMRYGMATEDVPLVSGRSFAAATSATSALKDGQGNGGAGGSRPSPSRTLVEPAPGHIAVLEVGPHHVHNTKKTTATASVPSDFLSTDPGSISLVARDDLGSQVADDVGKDGAEQGIGVGASAGAALNMADAPNQKKAFMCCRVQ